MKILAHDIVNDVALIMTSHDIDRYYVRYGLEVTERYSLEGARDQFAACQRHALAAEGPTTKRTTDMRNYSAFWSDQRIDDINSKSSFAAQELAAMLFQKRNPRRNVKRFQVVVVLANALGDDPPIQ